MDNYIAVIKKALEDDAVTVSVQDISEIVYDLVDSRILDDIVEACEATDAPLLCFNLDGVPVGNMSVLVGYGDESISDYHVNDFMTGIVGELV